MLSFLRLAWVVFVIKLLVIRSRGGPSSVRPLGEWGRFLWIASVCAILWVLKGERNSRVFRGLEGKWRLVGAWPSSCLSLGFLISRLSVVIRWTWFCLDGVPCNEISLLLGLCFCTRVFFHSFSIKVIFGYKRKFWCNCLMSINTHRSTSTHKSQR